jgi:hypothetical protein
LQKIKLQVKYYAQAIRTSKILTRDKSYSKYEENPIDDVYNTITRRKKNCKIEKKNNIAQSKELKDFMFSMEIKINKIDTKAFINLLIIIIFYSEF